MNYVPLLKQLRLKYPDATEEELWHGVAVNCYLRTGVVPREVELARAAARAYAFFAKYREDQPRVPAGVREGGQWTQDIGLVGTPSNPNPRGPKLIGQKPVEERPTIQLAGGGNSNMNWVAREMNIDRKEFGNAVHKLKTENKLGGRDNIFIDPKTGDAFFNMNYIGNIKDHLK